nr:hypothetical protein [Tanacetum cinerariifolium]
MPYPGKETRGISANSSQENAYSSFAIRQLIIVTIKPVSISQAENPPHLYAVSTSWIRRIDLSTQNIIRRIHQLDKTYRPFHSEHRIDLYSLSNIFVLPNDMTRLFETPGLVESSSPELDFLSNIKERLEEETTKIITETMEQYMTKPVEIIDQELLDPSGSVHKDANEHIEKLLEILDLFHIPEVTQDQRMLRVFPISLTGAASRWLRNKPSEPDENIFRAWERFKELLMKCLQHYSTDMHEVILFYNGLDVPTRQILDFKGAIPTKTVADAKIAIQEMAEYS